MKHTLNNQSKLTMLLLAFVLCFGFSGFAQSLKISGTVSGDGQPLPGVSILEKGTANGVVSDFDGNFEITAKSDGVLIFSYIGYAVQEVPVNGKATIDVSLSQDVSQLEEVVLIGYGAQKKKELTGAVAQVKAESIEQISTSDVGNALQGQVAGVNVTSSSGQPGDNAQILIRGINSVFGSNEPLYVVDGIPQDGNPQLSVAEIETIDVLKDAASAAIYGTRGSAGVILITTKTGKVGKMNIGVRSFYGVQDIQSSVPLMEFEDHQYRTYWTLNFRNGTFQDNSWTSLEQNPSNMTNNTNLMDMLQVDMASIQQHSINISGGKQGLTYNVSGNYFDQEGSLINSGLQRLNIRANTNYKKDRWTVSTGIGLRTDEQEFTPWRILLVGYQYQPYQTMLDPNDVELDNSAGTATDNDATRVSYFMSRLKRTEVQNSDNFNFNTRAQYDISDKMNVQARVGFNRTNSLRVRIDPVLMGF
jgi:TonB-linked SusC/RagA family outer membrane protein